MVGKYDVVHVQLFACIVKDNDPAPLVKNLMSLLSKRVQSHCSAVHDPPSDSNCACRLTEWIAEPGGYLQWNDVDINAQRLVSISESTTKPTRDMMALMSKPRNSSAFKYVGNQPLPSS